MKQLKLLALSLLFSTSLLASPTDIIVGAGGVSYSLASSSYAQSFTATAPNVIAGPVLSDSVNIYGANPPLLSSPTLSLIVELRDGEGLTGQLLDSSVVTVTSDNLTNVPHWASVDYYSKGISLTIGNKYTITWVAPVISQTLASVNWWSSTLNSNIINDPKSCYLYNATVSSSGASGGTWKPISQALSTDVLAVGYGPYTPGGYALGNPGRDQTGNGVPVITNNDYGCVNGQPVIGDFEVSIIDQTPSTPILPSCSGSGTITQSINSSKLFFVAGGNKIAYSNVYGSQGTTIFSYSNGAGNFIVGQLATWSGTLDLSGICVPSSITFDIVPVVTPIPKPTPTPRPTSTHHHHNDD